MAESAAEKARFPQIPGTVWWGVRAILNRSPNTVIDERLLGIELGVQEAAAKQYLAELVSVGMLSEDKKATQRALKWRLDERYSEAVDEILAEVYPQGLRDLAPVAGSDRQKAVSWFKHEGLGEGAAKNKAATYFLLGTPKPSDAPSRNASAGVPEAAPKRAGKANRKTQGELAQPSTKTEIKEVSRGMATEGIPLNVNVQIHIGADADSEQIEAIFSAMRRYLYDKQAD